MDVSAVSGDEASRDEASGDAPSRSVVRPGVERILLVELDGASYDLLVPLAESGRMPYLAEFLQTAGLVHLAPTLPCSESLAWSTFWSGCSPQGHGVLDDYRYEHRTRRLVPTAARASSAATLLDRIVAAGGGAVRVGGPGPAAAFWNRRPQDEQDLERGLRACDALVRRRLAAVAQADAAGDWRLLSVRLDVFDSLQHRAHNLLGLGDGPYACGAWIARTQQTLACVDRALCELFDVAQRRQAAVMIVSPSGFAPFRQRIQTAELLRRHELLHPAADGLARRAWRRARKLGALGARLLLPSRWRSDSVPPLQGSMPIDWRRSRAIVLHGHAAAMIYLNTRERFGSRVLRTRRQRDRAATDVLGALEEARHPVSGEPLFQDAYLTAERFGCDPLQRRWPEIVAVPAPGYYVVPQLSPLPHLTSHDRHLTAARSGGGLWMVRGPGVQLGQTHQARLEDVSASILAWLGVDQPRSMTGRPFSEIFQPAATAEPLVVAVV